MMGSPSPSHQIQTVQYIKKLMEIFDEQRQESQSNQDSLMVSESELSEATIRLQIMRNQSIKKERYARKYVSPYRQNNLSIRRIEATRRQPLSPEASFSNTLLQIATSRQKIAARQNNSSSRYRTNLSMMDKLEVAALDNIRVEARKVHQIQKKQRKQMSPRQKNEKWADFLLRERKWEEERRIKEMDIRQKAFAQERNLSNRVSGKPRQVPKMSRQDLIRKVKREKSKLQERLRELSQHSYKWKNVNIRGQQKQSPKKPRAGSNKLVISDPRQALFLVEYP